MPIEVGIWKLGDSLQRVKTVSMDSESRLEDYLCEDLSIIAPDLILIGRQITTDFGKFIDMLAMDADAELDPATERIIAYLSDNYGVPINAVFFQCFKEGDTKFLTRTWLIDPLEAEAKTSRRKKNQEPWNGQDFYVNFGDGSAEGEGQYRSWEDARRYGFVAAGGGRWYSRTMEKLEPGARVFVNIPKHGYVGVGIVRESAVPVGQFRVQHNGKQVPYLQADTSMQERDSMAENADDPEYQELMVRVDWIKAVPKSEAYWEKGMFANQASACKLRNRFTLERLSEHFNLND